MTGHSFFFFLTNYDEKSHLTSDRSAYFCIKISLSSVYVYICELLCVCEGERDILRREAVNTPASLSLQSCQTLPACAFYPMVQNREGLGKPLFPSLSFIFQPLPIILELETSTRPSLNHCMTRRQRFHPSKSSVRYKHCTGDCLTSEPCIL